jgi:hypothetical protein
MDRSDTCGVRTRPRPPTASAYVLARDEPAAVVVERIFADFLAGFGIFAIAERLTRDGIPPNAVKPVKSMLGPELAHDRRFVSSASR